jgi:hypothetical protein
MKRFFPSGALLALLLSGHGAAAQTTVLSESVAPGGTVSQKLELTTAQKSAIYAAVIKDKSKSSPTPFDVSVGAAVPPAIELYALPDEASHNNPAAKLYKYILVQDQVVVVDPTKMQVVDVIRH